MRPFINLDHRIHLRITHVEKDIYTDVLNGKAPKFVLEVEKLVRKKKYSDIIQLVSLPHADIPEDSDAMRIYALRVADTVVRIGLNAVNDMAIFVGKNESKSLLSLSRAMALLSVKGVCEDEEFLQLLFSILKLMFGINVKSSRCLGFLEFTAPNITSKISNIATSLSKRIDIKDPNVFAEALLIKMIRALPDEDVYILPIDLTPVLGKGEVLVGKQTTKSEYQLLEVKDNIMRRLMNLTTGFKAVEKLELFNSVDQWNSYVTFVRRESVPQS